MKLHILFTSWETLLIANMMAFWVKTWKNKRATINYCDRIISMGEVLINFDDETNKVVNKTHKP